MKSTLLSSCFSKKKARPIIFGSALRFRNKYILKICFQKLNKILEQRERHIHALWHHIVWSKRRINSINTQGKDCTFYRFCLPERMQMFNTIRILFKKGHFFYVIRDVDRILQLKRLTVNLILTCLLSQTIDRVWTYYYRNFLLDKYVRF